MFQPISRRTVLHGAGTALALPYLDAMLPQQARAQEQAAKIPGRSVFMCYGIGMNVRQYGIEIG